MRKLWGHIRSHYPIVLLAIGLCYELFYGLYHLNSDLNTSLSGYDPYLTHLANIALSVLIAGIFTASLRYLQFIKIFDKEFKKIVMSKEFEKSIKTQLKQITFSKKFLLSQSDLPRIWEKVTLCKYEQEFPHLYPKLKKRISNELFSKGNLEYYYKNYQICYDVNLEAEGYVRIIETSSFTIVRPIEAEFKWDSGYTMVNNGDERITANIGFRVTNMPDLNPNDGDLVWENGDREKTLVVSKRLKGKTEYHMEKTVEVVQQLDSDRVFSFASNRIIDDISISLKHSDNMDVFFTPVGKNIFHEDGVHGEESYINRDLFLPGEKYKIFLFRKN